MISSTDGSNVTTKWEYAPIQADTNGDYLTFQFVLSGAISATIQTYTDFPQTVDNDVLAAGATGFAAIDTVVDSILVDTGTTLPATLGSPAGADMSADVAAVKVDTAAILVDTGTTLDGKINTIDTNVDSILVDTAEIGTAGAGLTDLGGMSTGMKAEVLAEAVKVLTTQMTEAYAADGAAPTLTQALMLIQQALTEFAIVGTTTTIKKVDGAATAATLTLDDGTSPTSVTRAT